MFGKQAYGLLQEVAQCPADNLPTFNVRATPLGPRRRRRRLAPASPSGLKSAPLVSFNPRCATPSFILLQEEVFRSVIDEVHLQHERLTSVYK